VTAIPNLANLPGGGTAIPNLVDPSGGVVVIPDLADPPGEKTYPYGKFPNAFSNKKTAPKIGTIRSTPLLPWFRKKRLGFTIAMISGVISQVRF
jgi:hypothetical protein